MAFTKQRRVILVVGSTGQTGVQVARCLAQERLYAVQGTETQPDCVIFLVRSIQKGAAKLQGLLSGSIGSNEAKCEEMQDLLKPECRIVQCADVSDAGCLKEAFDEAARAAGGNPVTHVINALGTTDRSDGPQRSILESTQNLMKESTRVGVRRFVQLSVGYVTRPEAMVAKILNSIAKNIVGYHALAEDAIRSAAQGTSLDYVIVRPGGLDHGAPGDGFQVSQGDNIKGGSIRRSRLGEVLCKSLDIDIIPYRPSGGVTMEVCGDKSNDSVGPLEIGWGGFPVNKALEEDIWRDMLSNASPDPAWQGEIKDHLAEHQKYAQRFKISCGCSIFAVVVLLVFFSLYLAGMLRQA